MQGDGGGSVNFVISLPDELSLLIFEWLPFRELQIAQAVSREWRRLSSDWVLWKKLCIYDYDWLFRSSSKGELYCSLAVKDGWRSTFLSIVGSRKRYLNEFVGMMSAFALTENGLFVVGSLTGGLVTGPSCQMLRTPGQIVSISLGWFHGAFVTDNGSLFSWGSNARARGIGGTETFSRSVSMPTLVTALEKERMSVVSCGVHHTIAASASGKCYSWGDNFNRPLGLHTQEGTVPFPRLILDLKNEFIVSVSGGWMHSLALSDDGTVFSWGSSAALGFPVNESVFPTPIRSLVEEKVVVQQISAGFDHSLVLDKHGVVFAFGSGSSGRLGLGDSSDRSSPTKIQAFCDAGMVVVCISAGGNHSCFLTSDGDIYVAGSGLQYRPSGTDSRLVPWRVSETKTKFSSVSASSGGAHACAIDVHGTMYAWGTVAGQRHGAHGLGSTMHALETLEKQVCIPFIILPQP